MAVMNIYEVESNKIIITMSTTTIKASYTIIPAEHTPNTDLWLSPSDQVTRWTHASTIYVYKEAPNHDAMDTMRDSLSKILVHYYPLAGRLSWIEGHRLKLNCNAKGAILLEAESTKTLSSYGDFTPSDTIKNELTPTVDYTQPIEDLPLLIVQVTRFKGTKEGLVIGIALNHVLCDGLAAIHFKNSWAKLCKGDVELDHTEKFPFLDRTVMNSSTRPRFDHPELKPLPLLLGSTDPVAEREHERAVAVLRLTKEQVATLKEKTNNGSLEEQEALSPRPYSTYEVVSAHVWKCLTKARGLDGAQPTVVRVTADIRSRLNPPLPMNYFGNALAVSLTPTCFARDVLSNPLRFCARKIREAVELLKDDYVRSQLDYIQCQEQIDSIRASHLEPGKRKNAPFYGNPNLMIVSWMSMPVYEADFGWGKPAHFGPAAVFPDDIVYINRSSNGDWSIPVCAHLQKRHMELFNKFFYQDIYEMNSLFV
ncbi:hydroxycinnamoyl-CoA:piscidic acid hydroxycinnamoyltransferase-like [Lotus japonicus]|uniref:hydroxycinnamoyl-CoA:piscidic acid hydroxycinnamoyltransferase-like n=1 Tax=Lotus japonicus TaxID=34305 RepID=UPI00258D3844|nr:hydroxycinnamoyl-CoA:piscidic acid hydroxycinnamoyltransferase-like [Lotus japonicus]